MTGCLETGQCVQNVVTLRGEKDSIKQTVIVLELRPRKVLTLMAKTEITAQMSPMEIQASPAPLAEQRL